MANAAIRQSANECPTLAERRESSIASNRSLDPWMKESTARYLCGCEPEIDDLLPICLAAIYWNMIASSRITKQLQKSKNNTP